VVTGYNVHATDGEIKHVGGLLLDDETRAVGFLTLSTSNWWLDHRAIDSRECGRSSQLGDELVTVSLQQIKDAHVYDAASLPQESDERARLYDL
jgi:hypothetical protein